MEYRVDFDVNVFPFWSGAKQRVDELDYDQLQKLGRYIEETFSYDEEAPTDTEINDFVWFECDDFLEELMNGDDDEEGEEE